MRNLSTSRSTDNRDTFAALNGEADTFEDDRQLRCISVIGKSETKNDEQRQDSLNYEILHHNTSSLRRPPSRR